LNTSKEFVLIIFENVYFEDALFLFLLFGWGYKTA